MCRAHFYFARSLERNSPSVTYDTFSYVIDLIYYNFLFLGCLLTAQLLQLLLTESDIDTIKWRCKFLDCIIMHEWILFGLKLTFKSKAFTLVLPSVAVQYWTNAFHFNMLFVLVIHSILILENCIKVKHQYWLKKSKYVRSYYVHNQFLCIWNIW